MCAHSVSVEPTDDNMLPGMLNESTCGLPILLPTCFKVYYSTAQNARAFEEKREGTRQQYSSLPSVRLPLSPSFWPFVVFSAQITMTIDFSTSYPSSRSSGWVPRCTAVLLRMCLIPGHNTCLAIRRTRERSMLLQRHARRLRQLESERLPVPPVPHLVFLLGSRGSDRNRAGVSPLHTPVRLALRPASRLIACPHAISPAPGPRRQVSPARLAGCQERRGLPGASPSPSAAQSRGG